MDAPDSYKKLRPKQRAFVKHYIQSLSPTDAATKSYNTKNKNSAGVIGAHLMHKPHVNQAIEDILESKGLSLDSVVEKHAQLLANAKVQRPMSLNEVTNLIDKAYKLHQAYPASKSLVGHINLNKQYESMEVSELAQELKRLRETNERLMSDYS